MAGAAQYRGRGIRAGLVVGCVPRQAVETEVLGWPSNHAEVIHRSPGTDRTGRRGRQVDDRREDDQVEVWRGSALGVERSGFRVLAGYSKEGHGDVPGSRDPGRGWSSGIPPEGRTAGAVGVSPLDDPVAACRSADGGGGCVGRTATIRLRVF